MFNIKILNETRTTQAMTQVSLTMDLSHQTQFTRVILMQRGRVGVMDHQVGIMSMVGGHGQRRNNQLKGRKKNHFLKGLGLYQWNRVNNNASIVESRRTIYSSAIKRQYIWNVKIANRYSLRDQSTAKVAMLVIEISVTYTGLENA